MLDNNKQENSKKLKYGYNRFKSTTLKIVKDNEIYKF